MRLALFFDYLEEGWPSMDLVADFLQRSLDARGDVSTVRVQPPFKRRALRLPMAADHRVAFNFDRLTNRLWDYPRLLRKARPEADAYHVCDHSYAQLVHSLPADRAGVYCHDVDAFRCLLRRGAESRPAWFRAMTRHVLGGLQRAVVVFHSTQAVGDEIRSHGLVDPRRLVHAPYGIAPEFFCDPVPPDDRSWWPALRNGRFLLHVGSCIARKRIDVLIATFATARRAHPDLRLVQIGGSWTEPQRHEIARLGVADAIIQDRGLSRPALAALYATAAAVLQPSEAEGFGLPIAEALACGGMVIASDLKVLREVGGSAARYVPVGEVGAWAAVVDDVLRHPEGMPALVMRQRQAKSFSWERHADTILMAYRKCLTT